MKKVLKVVLLLCFSIIIKANENPTNPLEKSESITTTEESWDFEGRPELGLIGQVLYDQEIGYLRPVPGAGGYKRAYGLQELKGDFELTWNDKSGDGAVGVTKKIYISNYDVIAAGPYLNPITDYLFFNRTNGAGIEVREIDESFTETNKWDVKNVGPSNKRDIDSFMIKRVRGVISYYVNNQKVHATSRPTNDPLYIQIQMGWGITDLTLKYKNTEEDPIEIVDDCFTAEETFAMFKTLSSNSLMDIQDGAVRIYGAYPYASTEAKRRFTKDEDVAIEYTANMSRQKVGFVKYGTYDYKGFLNDNGVVTLRTQSGENISNFTTYTEGTIFRIEKIGNTMRYYQNGVKVYEEPYNLGDVYYLGVAIYAQEAEATGIKICTPKIKGNEVCSDDGETCVKVTNLLNRYDHTNTYSEIATNLIDKDGNLFPIDSNTTKANVREALNCDGDDYFYHVGINGDKSFFNNDTQGYDMVVLDGELQSFSILISNNSDTTKEYQLSSILPVEDSNQIFYRREANLVERAKYSFDNSDNLRVIGDPLPFLHSYTYDGRTSEPSITLYPNEVAKVVIEFTSSVANKKDAYKVIVKDVTSNNIIETPVTITTLDKPIPNISPNFIIYNENNNAANTSVDGQPFFEKFQEKYGGYGWKQIRGESGGMINPNTHTYNENGSIVGHNYHWNQGLWDQNSANMLPMNKLQEALGTREATMLLFWEIHNGVLKNNFKTPSGTTLTYLSDQWIEAYINLIKHVHDQMWVTTVNGIHYSKPSDAICFFLKDEINGIITKENWDDVTINQFVKLTQRLQQEGYKTLISFSKTSSSIKTMLPTLTQYIDIVAIDIENPQTMHDEFQRLAQQNEFELWSYYISTARYHSRSGAEKLCNVKAALLGYESCSPYEYTGSDMGWVLEPPKLYYGMNYMSGNPDHALVQHWNPLDDGSKNKKYVITQTSRFLAFSESLTDIKIIKYLKSLNNAVVNTELEKYNSELNDKVYDVDHYDIHRLHEISNELRLLYDEYYQGPISSRVATVKEEEKTEIPTFEEPVSFTTVYPNPTNGVINIKAEKDVKTWKLVSMSGKMIAHGQFNTPKRNFTTNIGNQASGLYVLQVVYTDGTAESKKVMKQ